jgi:hypothetical protein
VVQIEQNVALLFFLNSGWSLATARSKPETRQTRKPVDEAQWKLYGTAGEVAGATDQGTRKFKAWRTSRNLQDKAADIRRDCEHRR